MKSLQEFINESLTDKLTRMINEAKEVTIPAFGSFEELAIWGQKQGFWNKSNTLQDVWFYNNYKGNHVYLRISQWSCDGEEQLLQGAELFISKENKEPKWNKKVRIAHEGMANGDAVIFNFIQKETIYNKPLVDEYFGKSMPHMSGSESAVINSFNSFIQEIGSTWKVVKIHNW